MFFTGLEGSSTDWVPNLFNLSICGPLEDSRCGSSSSVCYSSDNSFFNLGLTSSRQVVYASRSVTITYRFSRQAFLFGDGNVTISLICGRTLVCFIGRERKRYLVWTFCSCEILSNCLVLGWFCLIAGRAVGWCIDYSNSCKLFFSSNLNLWCYWRCAFTTWEQRNKKVAKLVC